MCATQRTTHDARRPAATQPNPTAKRAAPASFPAAPWDPLQPGLGRAGRAGQWHNGERSAKREARREEGARGAWRSPGHHQDTQLAAAGGSWPRRWPRRWCWRSRSRSRRQVQASACRRHAVVRAGGGRGSQSPAACVLRCACAMLQQAGGRGQGDRAEQSARSHALPSQPSAAAATPRRHMSWLARALDQRSAQRSPQPAHLSLPQLASTRQGLRCGMSSARARAQGRGRGAGDAAPTASPALSSPVAGCRPWLLPVCSSCSSWDAERRAPPDLTARAGPGDWLTTHMLAVPGPGRPGARQRQRQRQRLLPALARCALFPLPEVAPPPAGRRTRTSC